MKAPICGQYLYSSCKGQDYGRVLVVGNDANGTPTIDIEVYDPQDIIDCEHDQEKDGFGSCPLTTLELPDGVPVILRGVQYRLCEIVDGVQTLNCNTPGNGCYRCTKFFWLRDNRTP